MAGLRKVTPSFPGTPQEWNGEDINTLVDLLHGVADIDVLDINSTITFRPGKVKLANPLNNHFATLSVAALTADRLLLVPDISANDDEIVCRLAAATIQNKTYNIDNNTFKHSTTNNLGDMIKSNGTQYARFPRGTAGQLLRTNAGATDIEWFTPSAGTWDPNSIETLTNKTLNVDANTIKHSTVNSIGDILVGTGTKYDRFAKGTALQVLRVNAAGTGVEWGTPAGGGDVSTTAANTYGDFDQKFRSGRVKIANPGNTQFYSIVGSAIAAARNLTLPLLAGDDEIMTLGATQTASNKTIGIDTNTLKHSTTNVLGDIYRYDGTKMSRFALGSANQVLSVNSGGTDITWATAGAGSAAHLLPDGTSTTRKWGQFMGGAADGDGLFAGLVKNGVTFSAELGTNEMYTVFTGQNVDAALCGLQSPYLITRRDYNPTLVVRFKNNLATEKQFVGFVNVTPQPTNSSTPLNSRHGAMFGFDDVDTNYVAYWNGGGSAESSFTTTTAKDTSVHLIKITLDNTNSKVIMDFDGTNIVNSTTNVPAATTGLYLYMNMENNGTSTTPFAINYAYLLQDK